MTADQLAAAAPITLNHSRMAANAAWGTDIGQFSVEGLMLLSNPWGYFGILGNELRVAWNGVIAVPGQYQIAVALPGGPSTSFTITVTPPPLPAATVQINGSASPVTVAAGASVSATVANGSGNSGAWLGVYTVGAPTGSANPPSWAWLATNAAGPAPTYGVPAGTVQLVVPAAAGQYEVRFFPTNNFTSAAASSAITVAAPVATPTAISFTPAAPTIADNAAAGAPVASAAVTMSDGSAFTGSLSLSGPGAGMFAVSGMQIVTARALTTADDGTQSVTLTATQGGQAISLRML